MSATALADTLAALQNKLQTITPVWVTAKLGVAYTPKTGEPWQRGTWIPGMADPVAFGSGVYSRTRCIWAVELFYPKGAQGVRGLIERAEIVRDAFFGYSRRAVVFGEGVVDRLPSIGPLREGEDSFLSIRVDVSLYVDDSPA